jgi:hypothetical protein
MSLTRGRLKCEHGRDVAISHDLVRYQRSGKVPSISTLPIGQCEAIHAGLVYGNSFNFCVR